MTTSTRPRPRHLRRSRLPMLAAATATLTAGALLASPGTAGAFPDTSFAGSLLRGSAHGGNGLVASGSQTLLSVGAIAKQSLGCNPALGAESVKEDDEVKASVNFLGSITLPIPNVGVGLKARQLRNTGYALASDEAAEVFEKATSSTLNVLDGIVTATSVQQTGHTRLDATGYHSDGEALFQDLKVDPDGAGPQAPETLVDQSPDPNTVIDLGPIGTLTLNEQILNATGITANAIHLHIGDYQGVHGDIYVAHVETMITKAPARISGFAFASRGTVAPLLASGKQALVNLPCSGTGEKDKVVTAGRLIIPAPDTDSDPSTNPKVLDEGALKSIVNGKTSKSSPYSRSTSRIESLKALVGPDGVARVSADAVQVRAYTFAGFDRPTYDATGVKTPIAGIRSVGTMELVNLVVDGNPITLPAPDASTTIDLPGLGSLVINEQRCKDSTQSGATPGCSSIRNGVDTHYDQITVTGLHLKVSVSPNPFGLPLGAELMLAVAHSDLAF